MVMERLDAAGKHPENQDPTKQFAIAQAKRLLRDAKVKDPGPKEQLAKKSSRTKETPAPTELNLETEWQRQAFNYVEHGYHTELGLTEEAYLASLPKFEPQPEEYRGKFDVPLLVETRIPWPRQAELAGIAISDYLRLKLNETRQWEGSRSKTPDVAYTGWFNNWGQRFTEKISPFDARNQLASDECEGSPFDGIAQRVHHPEVTRSGKYFDLISHNVGPGHVPCLGAWFGGLGLYAYWGGNAYPGFRPLVRGSKIVIG